MREAILQRLDKRPVVCDGAMGTMLYSKGISLNRCYDELNLSNPQLVKDVHLAYLKAGAEVLEAEFCPHLPECGDCLVPVGWVAALPVCGGVCGFVDWGWGADCGAGSAGPVSDRCSCPGGPQGVGAPWGGWPPPVAGAWWRAQPGR